MRMKHLLSLPLLMVAVNSIASEKLLATNDDEVLIVRNHQDQRFWKGASPASELKPPAYPKELLRAGVSGCVAIGFYIESDGSISNYRVLNSIVGDSKSGKIGKKDKRVITSMFGNAAVKSLEGLRFEPGNENPGKKRGFSYMHMSFSTDAMPLQRTCDIPDLEVFLNNKITPAPSK